MIKRLLLNVNGKLRGIKVKKIIRLDAVGGHCFVFLRNKNTQRGWETFEVKSPLKYVEKMVEDLDFVRVCNSTVIGLKFFAELVDGEKIKLKIPCGGPITLGHSFRTAFFSRFRMVNNHPAKTPPLPQTPEVLDLTAYNINLA